MFGMSFLNAGILLAGLATVIPLLIHLFIKNKPQKIYFSSLKFLREVLEERKKKMTLNQLLLLILRMLIILFVVFAIARPVLRLPFLNKKNFHPPTAVAFILDTSPSMDYVVNQRSLIQRGVELIKGIQSEMNSKDISLLLTSDALRNASKSRLVYGLLSDRDFSDINFVWTPVSLETLILQAQDYLKESRYLYREIFVLTDMQDIDFAHGFELPVTFIPVFDDSVRINLSCEKVNVKMDFINGTVSRFIEFELVNYSPFVQRDQIVRLNLNGTVVAEKMIDFNAFERKTDIFIINNENPGWNKGWVEIRNEQFLPDNRRYFTYYSDPEPKIAVVSDIGRLPRQIEVLSDIYIGENGFIEYLSESNIQLSDKDRFHYIIFYLNNYTSRAQALLNELSKNDYRVMIILSPDLNLNSISFLNQKYNIELKKTDTGFQNINNYNRFHSISGDFDFQTSSLLRVKPALNMVTGNTGSYIINAETTPVIFENKDILVNIDFSDRTQSIFNYPSFPVIVYRSLSWISAFGSRLNDYTVGNRLNLTNAFVVNPNGESYEVTNSFITLNQPGIWEVTENNRKTLFAVNMSDYSNQSRHKYNSKFSSDKINVLKGDVSKNVLLQDSGYEIWKLLLWSALCFLCLEMLIISYLQKKAKI